VHDQFFKMDGTVVLREALSKFPGSIRSGLAAAEVAPSEVAGYALHQANVRLLENITRQLDVDPGVVAITADRFGNTGAASPLTALWKLAIEGRAKRGGVILLGAIGAGFMWGALCFRLSDDLYVEEVRHGSA
jgi:3-oxoacyl-[acyl-carrier-protein] synthase-3